MSRRSPVWAKLPGSGMVGYIREFEPSSGHYFLRPSSSNPETQTLHHPYCPKCNEEQQIQQAINTQATGEAPYD